MRRASGFTLIELVLVTLIVSIGLVSLTSLYSGNVKGLIINEGSQQVAQYAQECAERVIAVRRDFGFASTGISNTMCDSLGALPAGFTRTVCTGTDAIDTTTTCPGTTYTGDGTRGCPAGVTCRNVRVTVSNGTVDSVVTVMLVNY